MESYEREYGEIPNGSIILTTLSPCNGPMNDRYGSSCTDLINESNIRKVYSGCLDPSQHNEHNEFNEEVTSNIHIQKLCKKFADTFLGDENHPVDEVKQLSA
jgi:pyrimidine deaminase RibD-like protein